MKSHSRYIFYIMRYCHPSLLGMRTAVLFSLLLPSLLLLGSCSLDDDRDLCCTRGSIMHYTYRPYRTEAFPDHIHSLRHFLFERDGGYIREVDPGEDLQYQTLSLPAGQYSMVTVGNMDLSTHVPLMTATHISETSLHHISPHPLYPEDMDNAEELYWGVRHFDILPDGTAAEADRSRIFTPGSMIETEMNNIHCHLTVHVQWDNIPDHIGDHRMILEEVPVSYTLDPERSLDADGFIVPLHTDVASHSLVVPMQAHELHADFITLRYTDSNIPILRLQYKGEEIAPPIDLGKAFRTWGWYPSRVHVQKYAVRIILYDDGRAELSPLMEAGVEDWIDGGTFS